MSDLTDLKQYLLEDNYPEYRSGSEGDNFISIDLSYNQSEYNNIIEFLDTYFNRKIDKLKQYMNMYFLYDGYDSKNVIILKDLEKKLLNQKKDLKLLYEKKDNLRSNIDYSNDTTIKDNKQKNIYIVNIVILVLISIILFMIILVYIKQKNSNK